MFGTTICQQIPISVLNRTKITRTSHEDQRKFMRTFIIISCVLCEVPAET